MRDPLKKTLDPGSIIQSTACTRVRVKRENQKLIYRLCPHIFPIDFQTFMKKKNV